MLVIGVMVVGQRRQNIEIARFEHVGLTYPNSHHVLNSLTQSFYVGSFTFLTGVSGAGKTTLLKLLYGGVRATSGVTRVFGKDVAKLSSSDLPQFRQRIGIVFQDCRLLPHLTVLDNVALSLKLTGAELVVARRHAKELLEWAGLGRHLDHYPDVLSDGQKQRVAIARAVINRPLLLLADEPTGNLDYEAAFRLIRLFEELNKIGTTILIATHNKSLIAEFPYPEVELKHGKLHHIEQNIRVSHG